MARSDHRAGLIQRIKTHQLWLLVWKNFTLRKRQPLRNVLEIAWPLIIFLILVAVRTRRDPENRWSRYYQPRALPSTGLLPFMQSFFCDYRGGHIHSRNGETFNDLPDVQNSRFAKLIEDAIPLIENATLRNRIIRLNSDYQKYVRDENLWNQMYQFYQNNTNVTRNALSSLLRDPAAFQTYLQNQIGLKPDVVQQLMTARLNQDQVGRLVSLVNTISGNASSLMQLVIGSGLNSLPSPGDPQRQWISWIVQNMGVVQALSQGQSLSAAQIREIACDDNSPVAIDSIIQVSQGNLSDVKKSLCSLNDIQLQNLSAEVRKQFVMPKVPDGVNTTMLMEQARVLQSLTGDIQNLYQDMLALQPLEKVVMDLLPLIQLMGQGAGTNDLICSGRYKHSPSNVTGGSSSTTMYGFQQAIGSLVGGSQATGQQSGRQGNSSARPWRGYDNCTFKLQSYPEYLDKLKNKTYAETLSFKDKCAMVDPASRIDCGWPGMSPYQCTQLGCCFDSSIKGSHYCFYEPKKAQCGCLLGTAVKSASGASDRTNQPSYDRGFIQLAQLFIRGKILFTPDNAITRSIVQQIKIQLSDIGLLRDFAVWWLQNSAAIRASLKDVPLIYRDLLQNNNNTTTAAQQWRTMLLNQLRATNSTLANQLDQLPSNKAIMDFLNSQNGTEIDALLDSADGLFKSAVGLFECLDHEYFAGYSDEESLVMRATNTSAAPVIASLVFENADGNTLPKHVKYKIRQDIDYTPRTDRIRSWYWRPGPRDGFGSNGYLNFGFVFLQDMIDRALMSLMFNETVNEPGIYLQQFPYPCYIRDRFVWYIGGSMPLLMTLAWVYSVAMIIKGIVYEKEKKLKEVMKVMGLGRNVHWIAWFINSSIMMTMTIILLVVIMKLGHILTHSAWLIVFLFLIVFMISTIMMCFLISVFFSRANVAAACGGIIFFVTYLPYSLVRWFEAFMSTSLKALACLSSTTAFGIGCSYFARYEEQATGVTWDNFYSSPLEGDGFSLGYTMTMMMVDAIIYGLLTWYLEAVIPGQFGIPKPWYFPLQKSFWFPEKVLDTHNKSYHSTASNGHSNSQQRIANGAMVQGTMHEVTFNGDDKTDKEIPIEAEPTHLPLGVSIKDLVKIYKSGNKLAVDGLNLNLYENQITSFLGHNGAGKTTTMSILTGLYPPTQGTAMISGKDIRTDIDLVRKSLGMCPQYNVLFDQLTVEDHLWFYSSLKGMEKSKIPGEIDKFLKDIGLENKRHEMSCNLSGGMKRKLSVGMAFIAGSKVVILDEPTAGVDPYARRGIWDLLLKYKPGRTVLLSTHHMDEADVLGDRIAIISQGKLQCCGSSLFLKGHYGNGYYLTLTKRSPGDASQTRPGTAGTLRDVKLNLEDISESASSDEGVFLDSGDSEKDSLASSSSTSDETDLHCSETSVSAFIKKHIPTAQLVEHVGSELTYVLPTEAAKEGKFQDMFEDLDRNLKQLRVGSYGVSDTTLEEVFLKVAEEAIDEDADKFAAEVPKRRFSLRKHIFQRGKVRDSLSDKIELLDNMVEENEGKTSTEGKDTIDGPNIDVNGKSSGLKYLFRQFWSLVIKRFHHTRRNRKAFLSQIILPAIFVCIAMIVAQIRPFYEMPPILLSTKMFQDTIPSEQYMMFADENPNEAFSDSLLETFLNYPGPGVSCVDGSCKKKPINFKGSRNQVAKNAPNCSCSTGISVCPAGAGGPKPRQWKSYSGDILQNMTGRDISDYFMKTHKLYIRKRYGAVTFGNNIRNLPINIIQSQDPVVKRMISYRNNKAWYDNKGYHAMPTYLNILSNNILRNRAKSKGWNPSEYGISTFNHPMNYTKEQLNDQTFIKQAVDVLVAICVVFALSFVPASFVVFLVNERATKAKHLHMVSGVRPYIYWTANYFWDMCNYLIPACICIFIFLAFNDESYTSAMNFPPTFLLLILYGWAITPLMYPASYLFSVPSTAYIVMICANLFIGINATLATFILELFQDDQELTDINNSLKIIFLAFPNYCLGRGLIDLAKNQFMSIFSRFGQNLVKDPFTWDITGRNIFAMIIQGFVFFAINVLIEYRFFCKQRPVKNVVDMASDEDDDVKQERQRVLSGSGSCTDAMRLVNLTKIYKVRKKVNVAVKKLCVGVSKGECFGLLGVNGAGKTTTFKMLTGDLPVTSGEAYVNGYSVLSEIHDAHQTMGYCPQFDALDDLLTAREHLYLYARLRGVPESQINEVVTSLIYRMNLRQYQDVCAGKYSGGNKRKLSTAIALVGNPKIVFMDEPTTGMDPKARRFLWNIITSIVKEGRTVILTSHSMEECEALCNRVAIMVNGQFKCLGSPQHLKNKYGDGYTVVLRVAGPDPKTEQVSQFIETVFPNAILKDKHLNMLEYQLPSQGLSVANVFGQLEANRKIFNIEDYSVSQTTLDQVFINFAKDQTDGMGENQPNGGHHKENTIEMPTMRYTHLDDGHALRQAVDV